MIKAIYKERVIWAHSYRKLESMTTIKGNVVTGRHNAEAVAENIYSQAKGRKTQNGLSLLKL